MHRGVSRFFFQGQILFLWGAEIFSPGAESNQQKIQFPPPEKVLPLGHNTQEGGRISTRLCLYIDMHYAI